MGVLVLGIQIVTSLLAVFYAWRIWQHDRESATRRREFIVFVSALTVALSSAIIQVFQLVDAQRVDAENLERFQTQLVRLDSILTTTTQLSQSTGTVADSLARALVAVDLSLTQGKQQLRQQVELLRSLDSAAALEYRQLREQQNLLDSQRKLAIQGWRRSFPLEVPVGVIAEFHFDVAEIELDEYVDSLSAWATRFVAGELASGSDRFRFDEDRGLYWTLSGPQSLFTSLAYSHEADVPEIRSLTVRPVSSWVQDWKDADVARALFAPEVTIRIRNRVSVPPLEIRLHAEPDSVGGFQLDRNRSPIMWTSSASVDFRQRMLSQWMATREAYVSFRTAELSVLDLPCGAVEVDLGLGWPARDGRVHRISLFFGDSESQWQLHIPGGRFEKTGAALWTAEVYAADLIQSVWVPEQRRTGSQSLGLSLLGEEACIG